MLGIYRCHGNSNGLFILGEISLRWSGKVKATSLEFDLAGMSVCDNGASFWSRKEAKMPWKLPY